MWRARSSWAWPTGQCPKPLGNIIIKYTMACGLTIYQSGTHLTGGGVLAEHLRDAAQVRSERFALRAALGLVDDRFAQLFGQAFQAVESPLVVQRQAQVLDLGCKMGTERHDATAGTKSRMHLHSRPVLHTHVHTERWLQQNRRPLGVVKEPPIPHFAARVPPSSPFQAGSKKNSTGRGSWMWERNLGETWKPLEGLLGASWKRPRTTPPDGREPLGFPTSSPPAIETQNALLEGWPNWRSRLDDQV